MMVRQVVIVESDDMLDPNTSVVSDSGDDSIIIAHGCNLLGGPVHGLAAAMFERFPEARMAWDAVTSPTIARDDARLGERGQRWFGKAEIVPVGVNDAGRDVCVANTFTQLLPGSDASFPGVCSGVLDVLVQAQGAQVRVPLIGAGIGGMSVIESMAAMIQAATECSGPVNLVIYVRPADGLFHEAARSLGVFVDITALPGVEHGFMSVLSDVVE